MTTRLTLSLLALTVLLAPPAAAATTSGAPNPARIVQIAQTVRFLDERLATPGPAPTGRARVVELCALLSRLGFDVPPPSELPADVTHLELATAVLTGRSPLRGLPPPPPRAPGDEDVTSNAARPVVLPLATVRLNLGPTPAPLADDAPAGPEPGRPLDVPSYDSLVDHVRSMLDARRDEVCSARADADPALRLVRRLRGEAERVLGGRPGTDVDVNGLVLAAWRGMGLPCGTLPPTWRSMDPEALARALSSGLDEGAERELTASLAVLAPAPRG